MVNKNQSYQSLCSSLFAISPPRNYGLSHASRWTAPWGEFLGMPSWGFPHGGCPVCLHQWNVFCHIPPLSSAWSHLSRFKMDWQLLMRNQILPECCTRDFFSGLNAIKISDFTIITLKKEPIQTTNLDLGVTICSTVPHCDINHQSGSSWEAQEALEVNQSTRGQTKGHVSSHLDPQEAMNVWNLTLSNCLKFSGWLPGSFWILMAFDSNYRSWTVHFMSLRCSS